MKKKLLIIWIILLVLQSTQSVLVAAQESELKKTAAKEFVVEKNKTAGILESTMITSGSFPVNVIMWYDIDHGKMINSRPDNGWWFLNPGYPADPVAGGLLNNNFYLLKRASDGEILRSARPPQKDNFIRNIWDVAPFVGTEVYIEIVDNNSGDQYAWLAADNFTIGSDTLDFESGTYADWLVVSGQAFGNIPNSVPHGTLSGNGGIFWADSWSGAGESAVGVLRSKIFTVSTNTIMFLKAGWDGPGGTGPWRTTTSLLGTYESQDPAVIRQHAYWIKALGCDVIASDLTNTRSIRQPGLVGDILRFFTGINKAFELQLKNLTEINDFVPPAAYPVIRLSGTEYDNLALLLDDVFDMYLKYPDKWYKFNDGTDHADKPFIEIFADQTLLGTWAHNGIPAEANDDRFNIRWSNGYLFGQSDITEMDANTIRKIPGRLPYWLFVENQEKMSSPGYYEPIYKEAPDGQGVEQMITWASLCLSSRYKWDGLRDTVDGKTPIVRYTEPVFNLKPKVLMLCRFNYTIAWPTEPQEGLSRNKSTHIEPNVDWGFLEFNEVANEMYLVRNYDKSAPPTPSMDSFFAGGNILKIKLDGFPLEYRISNSENLENAQWAFLNAGSGGIELGSAIDRNSIIYIQTRNSFGESQIGSVTVIDSGYTIDDKSSSILYDSKWEFGAWDGYYNSTCHYTWQQGATASYNFTGTGIKLIAAKNVDHGIAKIFIDGYYQADVDFYSESIILQSVVYFDTLLPDQEHMIEISATGTKRPEATGSYIDIDAFQVIKGASSSIKDGDLSLSDNYGLAQNYPNPFNSVTLMNFSLPVSCTVTLKVYDFIGYEVATIISGHQMPGNYTARFDASGLVSGVYFYRIQADNFSLTKKMILTK